eukprot:5031884-Amphidinium_carterae.1
MYASQQVCGAAGQMDFLQASAFLTLRFAPQRHYFGMVSRSVSQHTWPHPCPIAHSDGFRKQCPVGS